RRAGARNRRTAFRGGVRSHARRGRCRCARHRVAPRAGARRRPVSASLWCAADGGGAVGEAAAAWRRRACLSGVAAVIALFDRLLAPLLRTLDPEQAHALALAALKRAPLPRAAPDDQKLRVQALGLTFPNPVGVAAGFDKNAEVPDQLLRLGFGFVETGGVTPRPQPGNPRPRLFRLDADAAVINRLGFNSDGVEAVAARLAARKDAPGIVGINIGANKDTTDRAADYVACIERLAPVASFLTVNVSSPNTPGLRNLQEATALDDLLSRVIDARERAKGAARAPLLLKIAPDLTLGDLDDVVGLARRHRIDGMIVGNTTIG